MQNARSLHSTLLVLGLSWVVLPASAAQADSTAKGFAREMSAFVSGLDESQKGDLLYTFEDDERLDLRLAPLGLEGLRLDEMTDAQWTALEGTLGMVLSPEGLAKMNTIRSLEWEVAETEGGLFGLLMDRIRSAKRYFLAVFGEPSSESAWGMRFDGHHFSFNWTAAPGQPLSVTPLFLGGQPREVPEELERAGLRVLEAEEDRAVEFLNGLSNTERAAAQLPFKGGSAIRRPMSVAGDVPLEKPTLPGLGLASLDIASQARLRKLVDVVLDNFVSAIAVRYRERIEGQADSIRFAYAVADAAAAQPVSAGDSLYYRIQGADFLIEYDNTSEEADHIHVVWREFDGDFGRDLLGEHLDQHH
jgi:hypothetical protein